MRLKAADFFLEFAALFILAVLKHELIFYFMAELSYLEYLPNKRSKSGIDTAYVCFPFHCTSNPYLSDPTTSTFDLVADLNGFIWPSPNIRTTRDQIWRTSYKRPSSQWYAANDSRVSRSSSNRP